MTYRIISIQHGDYAEALETLSKGENESYFGMRYSLAVLHKLFDDNPHLVLSINTSQSYNIKKENCQLVGIKRYIVPKLVPETVVMLLNASRICKVVESFKPTHVLIRTGGIYAWKILEYCTKNNINTLVVFANTFDTSEFKSRYINKKLVRLLNHPCVYKVANHKRPAISSMIDFGVDKDKVVAWDWPNSRQPSDYPIKNIKSGVKEIVYIGTITYKKGVSDLVDAVRLLFRQGERVSLTVVGDGIDMERIKGRAGPLLDKGIKFLGKVGNDRAFQIMLQSDLVCIPSRHEFTEGMPLTLTEALASRTPVVISNHPVFKRAFVEGQGVSFFPEKESRILASVIKGIFSDRSKYRKLSRTTQNAFERVKCKTTFGNVVLQWRVTFN